MDREYATRKPLAFHGGKAGALAPFLLFLGGVAWLALSGAPDERGFWPILLAALTLGLLLARERGRYAETIVRGMSRPIVLLMVLAWLVAGVLASLMNASGFVEALVWGAGTLGVSGGGYVAAAFLVCCLVSTSTGTSLGTVLLCAPLLYPPGSALGAAPAFLMAAILGGATFGDNISPVSDTTIASANTQGAAMAEVVRTRLGYALPAAAVALVLYILLGGDGAAEGGASGAELAASPAGLPMIVVPALVIALLLARRHLLEGLLFGAAAAAGLGLLLGLLAPEEVLFIDAGRYSARGLIVDGVERGLGISVFTILLMGLVAGLEAAGLVDRAAAVADRRARTVRGAEISIVAAVSAAVILTTHSVVALLAVAPFARRTGDRFDIPATRRANLLDVTVCTFPFLLPYCIPTILAASVTAGGAGGMPRLAPLEIGLLNFHSWGLLGAVLVAVLFRVGEKPGTRY